MDNSVILTTKDAISIAGTFRTPHNPKGWALLIHMMPATKESFEAYARELEKAGIASLAIDLRGHGRSQGGPNGYESFLDQDHQKSFYDLCAGIEFLRAQGANDERLVLVGASIGANLCLQYMAHYPTVRCGVLLSPGADYRGILSKENAAALTRGQAVYFASSEDDGYNAQDVSEIESLVPDGVEKKITIFSSAGHGTTLLEKEPSLIKDTIDFIINNF